jgi:hypothetical protein
MVRLMVGVSLGLLACGTPCTRVAAAESGADDRGAGCNASRNTWSASKLSTCEKNLPDCSENDVKQFELYAKCLDALPRCGEGQRGSWEISRAACGLENLAFKVNLSCVKDL